MPSHRTQPGLKPVNHHLLHKIAFSIVVVPLALLSIWGENHGQGAEPARAPNVVLIMADDMGYECVRANGGESYSTPRLDRLAASGMRFTRCYSQPLCTPSRVQLMTGRYNSRNYIRFGLLDPQATTFGQLFRQAGYATCVAGKWQLSGGLQGPGHFGFDEYCLWQIDHRKSRYPNPTLEINGKVVAYAGGQYGPDIVSDYLCDFMERNKEKPFLAYYPMILPHWPFEPTPDSADWDPQAPGITKGVGEGKYFADMVAYTDKLVGKLVNKLDELGIRDNTLIMFTGDNGTYDGITSVLNGQPYRGGKSFMTEAGTHVPMIASWPGQISAGSTNPNLIDFSDFLPTMLEAAGIQSDYTVNIDGRSFVSALRGGKEPTRDWVYCWYFRNGTPQDANGGEAARTERYKLYRDGRFFDVAEDLLEKHPLTSDQLTAETKQVRDMLQGVIDQHTRPGYYEGKRK